MNNKGTLRILGKSKCAILPDFAVLEKTIGNLLGEGPSIGVKAQPYRFTPRDGRALRRPLQSIMAFCSTKWTIPMKIFTQLLSAVSLAALGAAASAGNLQVTVLDKDGKPVPDAVVVVVPATAGVPNTALPLQITVSQEKMRFIPAVSIVGVGAKARFVNNDPWEHHVRSSAAGAAQFNASTAEGFMLRLSGKEEGKPAKTAEATFDKAGAVLLGCHLHASMRGHVYVSESPWAAMTNVDGVASFDAVPDGSAQVKVWQADQLIDLAPQSMTLTPAPAKTTLQLSVVPRKRRV
jgi:plastocyanin